METLNKDLVKILEYEYDYVRQRHTKLVRLAQALLKESEDVQEDLKALGETLHRICIGEKWPFETPLHPRLVRIFGPRQEKIDAKG